MLTRDEIEMWRKICRSHWAADKDGQWLTHEESERQANTLCSMAESYRAAVEGGGELVKRLDALYEKATKGPWDIYLQPLNSRQHAKDELAKLVDGTAPFIDLMPMLTANVLGKTLCPALTGCGPTARANGELIVALVNAWPQIRASLATGVVVPSGMTNDELKAAIDYAWQKLQAMGSAYPYYAPMLEHYKALLKEQARRATLLTASPSEKEGK